MSENNEFSATHAELVEVWQMDSVDVQDVSAFLWQHHFIGIGLMLPLIILLWVPASHMTSLVVTIAVLVGYYGFRTFLFKASVYDPIMSFAPT